MKRAGGGGTMVLQLWGALDPAPSSGPSPYVDPSHQTIRDLRDNGGWRVYPVSSLEELLGFARSFAKEHYQSTPDALAAGQRGGAR